MRVGGSGLVVGLGWVDSVGFGVGVGMGEGCWWLRMDWAGLVVGW